MFKGDVLREAREKAGYTLIGLSQALKEEYGSDMHLFHDNSIRFDNRPFENLDDMHETIRTKWNNKLQMVIPCTFFEI